MAKFDKSPDKDVIIKQSNIDKFKESMEASVGNIQLALEDATWDRKQTLSPFTEQDDTYKRNNVVERSRASYKRSPVYKQAIELDKGFVLGKGVQRPVSKNPFIQYIIDTIWDAKENKRTFTGYKAMGVQIEQKDLTGELFFKIYVNETTGENVVRIERDTKKITAVITRPGDKDSILFYKYETTQTYWDYKNHKISKTIKKVMYIPDINNEDEEEIKLRGAYDAKNKVRMYGFLVAFGNAAEETHTLRGYPVYMQSLPWFKAHREIAEDVASMLKAKSRYAWEKKFPNGIGKGIAETMINATKSLTSAGEVNSVTPAVASNLYTNEKYMKNVPIDIKHDAKAFSETSKIIMQEIASGTGKSEHYYGNPSDANLATATAMELPVMKLFEMQQQEIAEIWEQILKFLILQVLSIQETSAIIADATKAGYDIPEDKELMVKFTYQLDNSTWENLDVNVFMPDIVGKETAATIEAINKSMITGAIEEKVGSALIYALLGLNNVDDIIAEQYGDFDDEDEEGMKEETARVAKLKEEEDRIAKEKEDS